MSNSSATNGASTEDGFQCRPMRLGSNRTLSPEGKRTSSETSVHLSKRNSDSSVTTVSRKKSIQIKNLPRDVVPKDATQKSNDMMELKNGKFDDMVFAICLVDFHHQRGPEIQYWKSNYHPQYTPELFKNIPFQALPDGSHLFEETFSNFNLVYDFDQGKSIDDFDAVNQFTGDPRHLKTLFGCSCVRQVKTSDLSQEERDRNKDITRSIVQKAVVVIVRKQPIFTKIKEKLSIITQSYFLQETFDNFEILDHLFDNLNQQYKLLNNQLSTQEEDENYVNLNYRSSILKFKSNFMIIFKSLLLEKKILIYSNNNLEMLTQFQNNLISLIPNLINFLDDSGCPLVDFVETNGPLSKPQSLSSNNRQSMLRFFGLPLQIFNTKNAFWNPYLPLQQLNELRVNSFMAGCSNLLFVNQATMFGIDLLVNLDTLEVTYPKTLSTPDDFALSAQDKKFISNLISASQLDPSRKNSNRDDFVGSDDYIRYQFEDYLNSLVAVERFHQYSQRFQQPPPGFASDSQDAGTGCGNDFNKHFMDSWRKTQNYRIWNAMADEFIFNFVDPKHIGHSLVDEPYSINKNIASFLNNFSFKNNASANNVSVSSNSMSLRDDIMKPHKFIDDEDNGAAAAVSKKSKKENEDDSGVDELVAGFEKVQPTSSAQHSNSSIKSSEPESKKPVGWGAGWGFGRK
ncbi:uncharacterized protein LODBEIA_P60080 [Lodderomyces beijingensis]|uniref:UDENN domain-containing protein n=1 Tax=Lodderomyces beijingensis TaxID=1775926 RepID=A0ABP0ZUG6_9ASCO